MTPTELLKGQVALVTGGARGIGRACAEELSQAGAAVIIVDRLVEEANTTARAIAQSGGQVVALAGDLAKVDGIPTIVRKAEEVFGRIDILVNNAGISTSTATESITEEQWDRIMGINLKTVFFVTQSVLPIMVRQGGGAIVNVGSVVGRSGGVNSTVDYTASKAGVLGMTRTLARQYAAKGIRVNAVAPGPIETDMVRDWSAHTRASMIARVPLGRLGTPKEVATVVLFLASPWAAYLTGVSIDVAGGLYMA
jgi:3-oxoacyl-[acyl-carrier protein] reductase